MNPIFSYCIKNPTWSPCAPHPKQWKNPLPSTMVNDAVFSSWNGRSAVASVGERDVMSDHIGHVKRVWHIHRWDKCGRIGTRIRQYKHSPDEMLNELGIE